MTFIDGELYDCVKLAQTWRVWTTIGESENFKYIDALFNN